MSDFEQLKPCPFCGGRAELDTQRGFLAFPNGKLENQVSIYCAGDDPCLADISICYSDHPDVHPDVVVRWAVDQWNTRDAKQSMQGEAKPVGKWSAQRFKNRHLYLCFEGKPITRIEGKDKNNTASIIANALNAPDSAALIAEQDAEIARLTKELEEAKNKFSSLAVVGFYNFKLHRFFDDVNEAKRYGHYKPVFSAIDAAIRQIGGAE